MSVVSIYLNIVNVAIKNKDHQIRFFKSAHAVCKRQKAKGHWKVDNRRMKKYMLCKY